MGMATWGVKLMMRYIPHLTCKCLHLHACYALIVSSSVKYIVRLGDSHSKVHAAKWTQKWTLYWTQKWTLYLWLCTTCYPLTKQHPSCQTCNTLSVCMNASTAHSSKLFHGTYAQAANACCAVQPLCAKQAICMLTANFHLCSQLPTLRCTMGSSLLIPSCSAWV